MIRARIQIGKGEIYDAYDKYGFVYLDADERTAPDIQDYTTTKYVEDSVEFIDTRTIEVPFDYKVKFLVEAPNGNFKSVNNKIDDFNKLLFNRGQGGMLYAQKVTLYNDLNRVKIVGYPKPVSEPTEVYHTGSYGGSDWIAFELTIHVANPKECVWATERNTDGMPEVVYNTTDAESGAMALTTQTLPIVLPDGTTLGKIYSHPNLRHITIPLRKGDSVSGTTQAYGNAPHWVVTDASGKALAYKQPRGDAFEPFVYISEYDDTVYFTFNIRKDKDGCYAVVKHNADEVRFETVNGSIGVMASNGNVAAHDYLRYVTIPLRKGDSVSGTTQAYGNAPHWVEKDETGKVTDYQTVDNDTPMTMSYTSNVAEGKMEFMIFNLREGTNSSVVFKRAK